MGRGAVVWQWRTRGAVLDVRRSRRPRLRYAGDAYEENGSSQSVSLRLTWLSISSLVKIRSSATIQGALLRLPALICVWMYFFGRAAS